MSNIIEKVFDVYGNELPKDRDLYQAKRVSPVSMLEIRKAFGSYEKFRAAYLKAAMDARNSDTKVEKTDFIVKDKEDGGEDAEE